MGLFKDMLGSGESVFLNELALDYSFLPKLLPFRESEQHYIAQCIAPLLQGRTGKNLLIHGAPGIGKTAAARMVLKELEEEYDEVECIYINCWTKNTTFKIYVDICEQLGYKLTHNKRSDELFNVIKNIVNKKSAVFVFDEIDKVEDTEFLYTLVEEIFKKTIILITNHEDWVDELEPRVRSRVLPEKVAFRPYSAQETKEILKQRSEYAFVKGAWDAQAFALACEEASRFQDIRAGLYLLKEAGQHAEMSSSKKITSDHVKQALAKMDHFTIKDQEDLEDDAQRILEIIKAHDGSRIGDLYEKYKQTGATVTYKTFQRRIRKLADNRFIDTKRVTGKDGNTTIIEIAKTKKLSEFGGFK
ncbi:AAA family ATPase [Candidatus Woesearchaeota archaeon]|nr:MAG: AAA family ATPase [Candidatus Woesearchaeota archaeon]